MKNALKKKENWLDSVLKAFGVFWQKKSYSYEIGDGKKRSRPLRSIQ